MRKLVFICVLIFSLPFQLHAGVPYAEILADPDNIELNQKYAVEQLEAGNAKGALAAIERVLAAQPTDLTARLFRARILMARGSDLQADSELQALSKLPLPDAEARMVANMRDQISTRRRAWQHMLTLGLGLVDSDNVNNYPASGMVTLQSQESSYSTFDIAGNEFKEKLDDQATTYNVSHLSIYDPQLQTIDQIFANFAVAGSEEGDTGYLAYQSLNASLGVRMRLGETIVTPRVSFSDIDNDFELLGDLNITSYGLDAYRKISDALQASGGLSYVERGYEGAKSTRDGNTMGISAGINYLLSPRTNISFSANYQRVDADTDADQDKSVIAGQIGLSTMPANGHIVSLAAIYSDAQHDNKYSGSIGALSSGKQRGDQVTSYRLNYTVLGQSLATQLRNFRLQAGYNFSDTRSNLTDFTNDNRSFTLTLSYMFSY